MAGELADDRVGSGRGVARPEQERRRGALGRRGDGVRPLQLALDDTDLAGQPPGRRVPHEGPHLRAVLEQAGDDVATDTTRGSDDEHRHPVTSRVLPGTLRFSIAACASDARANGTTWPMSGWISPVASSASAASVSRRSSRALGRSLIPITLTPRRSASASTLGKSPLAAP